VLDPFDLEAGGSLLHRIGDSLLGISPAERDEAQRTWKQRNLSPTPEPAADRLLSVKEVAKIIGQKPDWVYAHQRELPRCEMPGRSLRFSEAGLRRWMKRRGRG
jgi:predicted DNA-binding transcriptional regulator AlpA